MSALHGSILEVPFLFSCPALPRMLGDWHWFRGQPLSPEQRQEDLGSPGEQVHILSHVYCPGPAWHGWSSAVGAPISPQACGLALLVISFLY